MMEEEILYYLKLLHFLKPREFEEEDLSRITDWLLVPRVRSSPLPALEFTPNVIEEVENKTIILALVRTAKNLFVKDNSLIYNKKAYRFNNVFNMESYEDLINQSVDFTNKRIQANKNTSLIYHGYSGSGKSTLLDRVLESYSEHKKFKLYEIYLNKIYIYFNGLKVEVRDVDDPKYEFETLHIRGVMEKFARKKSNGINLNSSRSHMILELIFDRSKLTCIDLCGNEKSLNKALIDETAAINKSLFNLSRYLTLGEAYKDRSCCLTNLIRGIQNIMLTVIFNDNLQNYSFNHLLLIKDILKKNVSKFIDAVANEAVEAFDV